ncbi:Sodium/hydrogen exchanger [Trametes gibbosa]|nr:Sodium/hydrogen exchanger [Trametes gibbosa]
MPTALPFEEPSLIELLVCSSFLYILNAARVAADYVFNGGIIAEIAFGMVYGSPLASLLPPHWEETFTVLGYLGLILVVFEGGLSTDLPLLLSNLPLSTFCALVGIGLPIGISYALLHVGFGYRPLEAFAAGAALSSTSLGTTLAALNSVMNDSFQRSRIRTVLVSAAIIDDVIGLVIAAVIPALASVQSETSQNSHSTLAWMIIRPLLSSFSIALVSLMVSWFCLRPLFWYRGLGELCDWGTEKHADAVRFFLMVGVVSAMAAVSYYTRTSILYGAYIAGLILTYVSQPPPPNQSKFLDNHEPSVSSTHHNQRANAISFEMAFARVVGPIQEHVFLPLFFASIGFAIPFLNLWDPTIIWRGVVYSILMCLAKLAVGLPILLHAPFLHLLKTTHDAAIAFLQTRPRLFPNPEADAAASLAPPHKVLVSLPTAVFMGVAMVARGEIGLLIAQLARGDSSSGRNPGLLSTEPFLLCIWAILLCTLVGPISLGFIVRKWGAGVTAGIWA